MPLSKPTSLVFLLIALAAVSATAHPALEEQDAQLVAAVTSDNAPEVRDLLRRGADPNTRLRTQDYRRTETVLMEAASRDDSAIAAALIDRGASLNAVDRHGLTALAFAAISESPSCTCLLLRHGANPNIRDVVGETPLMYVAGAGSVSGITRSYGRASQVARLLLDAGAQANAHGGQCNETALMDTAEDGNVLTAKVLLAHGADIHATDDYGRNATAIARIYFQWRMLALLNRSPR